MISIDPVLSNSYIDASECVVKVDNLYMDFVGVVKKQHIYGIGSLGVSQTSSGMTQIDVQSIKEQSRVEGRAKVQQILDVVVTKQGELEEIVRLLVDHVKASVSASRDPHDTDYYDFGEDQSEIMSNSDDFNLNCVRDM